MMSIPHLWSCVYTAERAGRAESLFEMSGRPEKHKPTAAKKPRTKKRRISKESYFSFLGRRWGKLSVRGWLEVLGVVIVAAVIYGIFFVKRELLEYRPAHSFTVRDPEFFGSAHAAADPVPIGGNRVTLLHNGDGIFPPLLESIRQARRTINFEAFLFHSGTVGKQFVDAFCERAQAGVQVRILLDGVGSANLDNDEVKRMKAAGCKFAYYHPTRALRVDKINRRSHRRVMVVDGQVAYTGGVGFADDWQGDGEGPKNWRDVHAKIEGPLVAKLQGAFQQHWLGSTKELLSGADHFPELIQMGNLPAQVVASHEFSVAPLPLVQAVAISAAQDRIYITNPYCTPTKDQVHLLTEAVKRGVDVKLILPGQHNDQPITKAAGRGSYGKLLEGGVQIFEYEPSMIHSKTMVVDGLFSVFGTSNLDARSSQINEEIDVTVYDESFGAEMDKVFLRDLERSRPYTLEEFKKRSLWERISEWLAKPFNSQL